MTQPPIDPGQQPINPGQYPPAGQPGTYPPPPASAAAGRVPPRRPVRRARTRLPPLPGVPRTGRHGPFSVGDGFSWAFNKFGKNVAP